MEATDGTLERDGQPQGTFAAWIHENNTELAIRAVQCTFLVFFAVLAFLTRPGILEWVLVFLVPTLLLIHVVHQVVRTFVAGRHMVFERAFMMDLMQEGAMESCLQPDHTFWSNSHTLQALRSLDVRPGFDRMVRQGVQEELRGALDVTGSMFKGYGTRLNISLYLAWLVMIGVHAGPIWFVLTGVVFIVGLAGAEILTIRIQSRQGARLQAVKDETARTCIEILRNETGRAAEAARPFRRTEPIRNKPWIRRNQSR